MAKVPAVERLLVQNFNVSLLFLSRVQRASVALQICICLTLLEDCAWKHCVVRCLIFVSICLIIVWLDLVLVVAVRASCYPNLVQYY